MTKPDCRCHGWHIIWAYAIAHNCWAAGRREPMLSDVAKAYHHRHPVLSTVLAGGLLLHLSGRAPAWADPIHWVGVLSDATTELARRW